MSSLQRPFGPCQGVYLQKHQKLVPWKRHCPDNDSWQCLQDKRTRGQRGANFGDLNFKKRADTANLTILVSKPLTRHSVVRIFATSWAAGPPQLPFLGADFLSQRSHKTLEKHNISRNCYPPKPAHLTHLSCVTSQLYRICATTSLGWQIFCNSQ